MAKLDLYNMDCMELMAQYPDKHFELAIVDPPYGIGEHGGKNRDNACASGNYLKKDWDEETPSAEYFEELFRVSKSQIIWGSNYMPSIPQGGRIVWDKMNDGSNQSSAEIAYCSLNNRVDIVRYMWRGMIQGTGIGSNIQIGDKSRNEKRIHPTQKPALLYKWILHNYAKQGDKILDTHGGSMSIAIACHQMGFDLTLSELDKDYYDAGLKRVKLETAQRDLFVDTH